MYNDVWPDSMDFIKSLEIESGKDGIAWIPGAVRSQTGKGNIVDNDVRVLELISLPRLESAKTSDNPVVQQGYDAFKAVSENLEHVVEGYAKSYGVAVTEKEGYQILRYKQEDFFTTHVDDSPQRPRRLSFCYYPNDNYVGGEIEFGYLHKTIKPRANQLIVFPSNYIYAHQAKPIQAGTKYVVASWWN